MKKLLLSVLVILLSLSLISCSSKKSGNDKVKIDEKTNTVTVIISSKFFDLMNSSSFSSTQTPEQYCLTMEKEGSVSKAVVNEDGSVTLTMSKENYDKLLTTMKTSLDQTIAGYTNGTTFPSIKEITYTDDLSEIKLTVDYEAFSNSMGSFAVLGLGLQGYLYRIFIGQSETVKITYIDETTGKSVESYQFPDDMKDVLNQY